MEATAPTGTRADGMPGQIVTRGLLVDVPAVRGVDAWHHTVYAVATGIAYEMLDRRR